MLLRNRYRIIEPVGKGGMGVVFKADDTQLANRPVAVKVINFDYSKLTPEEMQKSEEVKDAIKGFEREAFMLAKLAHPNLPAIYEYFEEDGSWFLVMSFIQGETLENYLHKSEDGRLPLKEVLQIGITLCDVLNFLHTQPEPIIFRDLKPSNIMRTPDGHLFLIDFGIARHFKPGQLIDTYSFISQGYAAPEQYGKAQTTIRTDIYSLGATLHYLLTGHPPYESSNPFEFQLLEFYVRPVPRRLQTLITCMVANKMDERPANMEMVKQELKQIVEKLTLSEGNAFPENTPNSPPVPSTVRSSPQHIRHRSRNKRGGGPLAKRDSTSTQPVDQQQNEYIENIYETEQQRLIKEGWQLLDRNQVADALLVGTSAVQQDYHNPEAHVLLGYAHYRWGEYYKAEREFDTAISLRPNVASYYYGLGIIYEAEEEWDKAHQQYLWAVEIEPKTTSYRADIGRVLIKLGKYRDSIEYLESCLQEEPNNATYRSFLAQAYTSCSHETWAYVPEEIRVNRRCYAASRKTVTYGRYKFVRHVMPEGYYATTKAQVQDALNWLQKAEALKVKDTNAEAVILQSQNDIKRMLRRRFHVNKIFVGIAIASAILLALIGWKLSSVLSWELSAYFVICTGLYIASCMTPQYLLNRKIIGNENADSITYSTTIPRGDEESGCLTTFLCVTIVLSLPIVTIWNFMRNYALTGQFVK